MSIDFIKLHPRIEEAQNLDESPLATLRYTSQIQLIPFDPLPYTQITAAKDISLTVGDDYKVYLVRCRDNYEVEVTNHVNLTNVQVNGRAQLRIIISYLLQDFGTDPVYFKIDRIGDANPNLKVYYSNKFLVTANKKELTSRIDYKNIYNVFDNGTVDRTARLESINLQFYFNNHVDSTDVETYYQITRNQNINTRILINELSEWQTQIFDAWTYKRLARAFYGGRCYINQIRNYPIDGLDYQNREGHTNVSEMTFVTDPDDKDFYSISPIIIDESISFIPFRVNSSTFVDSEFYINQTEIPVT